MKKIKLKKLKQGIFIKEKYKFGNDLLKPLRGGEYIKYSNLRCSNNPRVCIWRMGI